MPRVPLLASLLAMTRLRPAALLALAAFATGCPKPSPTSPDPSRSEIAVDRLTGAVADGADQVQITVTVRDGDGHPVPGVQVQLAATGMGNTLVQPQAATGASGVATGTLATTVAEPKTVSASIAQGAIPGQPLVAFMPGVPRRLAFTVEPANSTVGQPFTAEVTVQDAFGNTAPVPARTVSLALAGGSPATLGGTRSLATVAGVARFADLHVDTAGTGYSLSATAGGLPAAASRPFAIASATPGDVTGTQVLHYVTDDGGVTDVPQDLSGALIGAYISNDAGSYTFLSGTGTTGGTFRIQNVPPGVTYYLRFGDDYIQTNAREIDLGFHRQGRPDVAVADAGTYHHLFLTGMTPWSFQPVGPPNHYDEDEVQMYSANADVLFTGLQVDGVGGGPAEGDTLFDQTISYDFIAQAQTAHLVDGARGDQTYLTHLTLRDAGFWTDDGGNVLRWNHYRGLEQVFGPASVTVADGQTSNLAGPFQAVPQQGLQVTWLLKETTPGSFGSYRTAVNPNARTDNIQHFLTLLALPNGAHGFYADAPYLMAADYLDNALTPQDDQQITFQYGDPFPAGWTRFGDGLAYFEVPYQVPRSGSDAGATAGTLAAAFIRVMDAFPGFPTAPLRPRISPVTGGQIDGVSLFSNQTLASATPTIQWSPPAVGTPAFYEVRIRRLSAGPSGGVTKTNVAWLLLTGTRVEVPPGLFQPGGYYEVRITAFQGTYSSASPYELHFPESSAPAFSGLLSVP